MRNISVTYVFVFIGLVIVVLLWMYFVLNGHLIVGKGNLGMLGKFEEKMKESIILIFPVMVVTLFHKSVFTIYYFKYYYWDNKDKESRKKE